MGQFHSLLIIILILLIYFSAKYSAICELRMSIKDFDKNYSLLLELPLDADEPSSSNVENSLTDDDQISELKVRLEMAIFLDDILAMIYHVHQFRDQLNASQEEVFSDQNFELDALLLDDSFGQFSVWRSCEFWKFWRILGNVFYENQLLDHRYRTNVELREKFDPSNVNCLALEELIIAINKFDELPEHGKVYLKETRLAHFYAISNLLQPIDKEYKGVQIGFINWQKEHKWNFLQFFDEMRLDTESNLAYQMRMLHINNVNDKNREQILTLKNSLKKFLTPNLALNLEFRRPLTMAIEIIDDNQYAKNYMDLLCSDENISLRAEISLSKRMYFGRIWAILMEIQRLKNMKKFEKKKEKKMDKILANFEKLWDQQQAQKNIMGELNDSNDVICLYTIWHQLATLYNEMPLLKGNQWINIMYPNLDILKKDMALRDQLLEDHTKNMIRLYYSKQSFEAYLKNSIINGKGIISRLKSYYINEQRGKIDFLENILHKCPKLGNLLRNELSDSQITELQIKNYVNYFDFDSTDFAWNRARLMLNLLAYYQCFFYFSLIFRFQNHLYTVSKSEFEFVHETLAKMELWMDSLVANHDLDLLEWFNIDCVETLNEIRQKYFPQENEPDLSKTPDRGNKIGSSNQPDHDKKHEPGKTNNLGKLNKTAKMSQDASNFLYALHGSIIEALLHKEEFVQGLKAIFVDSKRMSEMILSHSKTFKQLIEASQGKKDKDLNVEGIEEENLQKIMDKFHSEMKNSKLNTKEDHEAFHLTIHYAFVMFDKGVTVQTKHALSLDITYLYHKMVISEILCETKDLIKTVGDQKFKRALIQANIDVMKSEFFEELDEANFQKKSQKICEMNSFLEWIVSCQILRDILLSKWLMDEDHLSISTFDQWVKPADCENQQIAQQTLDQLNKNPKIEEMHLFVVIRLMAKFPQFLQLLADHAHRIEGLHLLATIGDTERVRLYENILAENPLVFTNHDALLDIKIWIQKANDLEIKAFELDYEEVSTAKAQTYAMLKILQMYTEDQKLLKMFCPMIKYMDYLDIMLKGVETNWSAPHWCFSSNYGEDFLAQRQKLYKDHFVFLKSHLDNCNPDDGIARKLREKRGKMMVLQNLVGRDGPHRLWESAKIREILRNPNYFTDNLRLLSHYHSAISGTSTSERLNSRICADIMVWTAHLDQIREDKNEFFTYQIDKLWIYLRVSYDRCQYSNQEEAQRLSYMIKILIPKIRNFIQMYQNRKNTVKNDAKFKKIWDDMEIKALGERELVQALQNIETVADPVDFIQEMHFKNFQKFMEQDAKDRLFSNAVSLMVTDIITKSDCRSNLLQLLKLKDIKIFFDLFVGIPFVVSEFITNNKIKNELILNETKNDKIVEENSDQSENSKRTEKNRRKKENKRKKKAENKEKNNEELENKNNEVMDQDPDFKKLMNIDEEKLESRNNNEIMCSESLKNSQISKELEEKNQFEKSEGLERSMDEDSKNLVDLSNEMSRSKVGALNISLQNSNNSMYKIQNSSNNSENANKIITNNCLKEKEKLENESPIRKNCEDLQKYDLILEELPKMDLFEAFSNNSKLYEKYSEFVENPSEEKRKILNILALIHTIEQRLKSVEELEKINYFLNFNEQIKLKDEWNEIKKSGKIQPNDELHGLQGKLQEILQKILNLIKNRQEVYDSEKLNQKIHLEKFAMTLLENNMVEKKWSKVGVNHKKETLRTLFQEKYKPNRFESMKIGWLKMIQQVDMDIELSANNEFILKNHNWIIPSFPKISQQLYVSEIDSKLTKNLENNLSIMISKELLNNMTEEKFDQKIRQTLVGIQQLIDDWSERKARLLISGSYQLGSQTYASDIDLICVVPGKSIEEKHFFDEDEAICRHKKCSNDSNLSLYCRLCESESVTDLIKIPFGTIFNIKCKFNGIDLDIPFVAIPELEELPEHITDELIEEFLPKFDANYPRHKMMLRPLSSYRSTLYICNILNETRNTITLDIIVRNEQTQNKTEKVFRNMLLSLKLWAKNHFLYSNKYGLLNGVILSIMVAKVMLLYPHSTLPFLMEKFFLLYSSRPLNLPIQLTPINTTMDPFFIKNPAEQEMPIYTPAIPMQNAARIITHSGARTIRREMIEALNILKSMRQNNFRWETLIEDRKPFIEKFENFILINCACESAIYEESGNFCQFVDGRIRLQLVKDIDKKKEKGMIETQMFPDYYAEDCRISKKLMIARNEMNLCKVWLLGISTRYNYDHINIMLSKFDTTIKMHYLRYHPMDETEEGRTLTLNEKFRKLKCELKSVIIGRTAMNHLNLNG